jgi:hypothetical protein
LKEKIVEVEDRVALSRGQGGRMEEVLLPTKGNIRALL